MVIHKGGRASGFKNVNDADSYDDDGVSLFHVRGSNAMNVCGVQVSLSLCPFRRVLDHSGGWVSQVEERATSLNSMDCFVLVTPTRVYSWHGTGALPEEVSAGLRRRGAC
jgi:hypothetical protein